MKGLSGDKWVQRWAVPSSSGGGYYIIGKDADGNYGCSCLGWTSHIYCKFCHQSVKKGQETCPTCGRLIEIERHDCSHIREVKAGRGKSISEAVMGRMLS